MLINMERQYDDFIENLWLDLSKSTRDILEFRKKPAGMYNFISLRLTRFLQLELKKLEAENKSPKL